ncbi:MAG: hypothetical protein CMI68_01455 [Candidatus Pelagibacter sp.]|nr:hypothetical protein [Candidatus Pelagibacter sp.]|tara:strand:+ start:610 stop:828 length:219 start_codon:yes stop_codon:yes gene_type:complete
MFEALLFFIVGVNEENLTKYVVQKQFTHYEACMHHVESNIIYKNDGAYFQLDRVGRIYSTVDKKLFLYYCKS